MWISKPFKMYRSFFLLVRVRSGGFRMTLPLALFLIDESFDIIGDMLWIAEKFIPKRVYEQYLDAGFDGDRNGNPTADEIPPIRQILELCREMINELRRYGRYSLVEVEVGKGPQRQAVSVEFF